MFIKTFGKYLIDNYPTSFNLISIKRPVLATIKSFTDLDWFGSRYIRASNWIYKPYTIFPSLMNKVTNEIEMALLYIISEKLNEVFFYNKARGKCQVNLIEINIPTTPIEKNYISERFNLGPEAFSKKDKNDRSEHKVKNINNEIIVNSIEIFLKKYSDELRKNGVLFKNNSISIEDREWVIYS